MSKSARASTSKTERPALISEQQIAERAYALYLARGAEGGDDLGDFESA
jgi:hypothetical protein